MFALREIKICQSTIDNQPLHASFLNNSEEANGANRIESISDNIVSSQFSKEIVAPAWGTANAGIKERS